MKQPEAIKGTKVCVVLGKNEIKMYGNKQFFITMAKMMTWVGKSDSKENYEFHLNWHLNPFEFKRKGKNQRVWFKADNKKRKINQKEFEVTFMNLTEKQLKKTIQM